jgi:SAM-dependent methyltransferase
MRTRLSRPTATDFDFCYRISVRPENLPWYHAEPPKLLQRVVASRSPGRALDIGCGDGMCSIYLARAGYSVTSLDFSQGAIEMTSSAAAAAGVHLNTVRSNVLSWPVAETYDLILDSCCLHVRAFRNGDRPRYKQQILRWLAADGDYVLIHFDRMHLLDWRPVGPRRRSRRQIRSLFSPQLEEQGTDCFERSAPMPVGPVVRERAYWFRWNGVAHPEISNAGGSSIRCNNGPR